MRRTSCAPAVHAPLARAVTSSRPRTTPMPTFPMGTPRASVCLFILFGDARVIRLVDLVVLPLDEGLFPKLFHVCAHGGALLLAGELVGNLVARLFERQRRRLNGGIQLENLEAAAHRYDLRDLA